MRPSAFLRAISFRSTAAPVAPWPPAQTPFDKWLTTELEDLRLHPNTHYTSASWLTQTLDLAISAHTAALDLSTTAVHHGVGRKSLEQYLDGTIDLLDACISIRDRIDSTKTYTDSLSTAARRLEYSTSMERARQALDSCEAMERRCLELPNLRKLGEKPAAAEALSGCRSVALLAVGMVGVAVSFKSRRGVPALGSTKSVKDCSWAGVLHEVSREAKEEVEKRRRHGAVGMRELDFVSAAARSVRGLIDCRREVDRGEIRLAAGELGRRCVELEESLRVVGERVDELYRRMVCVRVSLLGVLSEA